MIGNYKSDNLSSQNLLNFSHLKAQLLHQNSCDDDILLGINNTDTQSNNQQLHLMAKKDVKNILLNSSKHILGCVLSPTRDKNSINAIQHGSPTILYRGLIEGQSTSTPSSDGQSEQLDNSNVVGVKSEAETVGLTNVVVPSKTIDVITANVSRLIRGINSLSHHFFL